MSNLRAVFFDIGNTLIAPAQPMAVVLEQVLVEAGYSLPPVQLSSVLAATDATFWSRPHELTHAWGHPLPLRRMWFDYYQRVFARLGLTEDNTGLCERMIDYYYEPEAWALFSDVHEALSVLQQSRLALGVISDWGPALTRILSGLRLTRYFAFVLASANVGIAKPNSELYRLALKRAGVRPGEALMIGDSYYNDILGARASGIDAVLIDRSARRPPVDCPVIADLHELLEHLEVSRRVPVAERTPAPYHAG